MQPVWDEYVAASRPGRRRSTPSTTAARSSGHAPQRTARQHRTSPVVLAVAADLRGSRPMDGDARPAAIVPGASIYPFCWNVLLAARERGLGGVMTTFLSRVDSAGR